MSIQYKDKWAFIMGGSIGIGYAIAEVLLAKGARVLIMARKADVLEKAARQLESQPGNAGKVKFAAVDATDETALKAALNPLFNEGITPYFLFNCAGRALPDYFENISTQQLQDSFQLNVVTAWNTIQTCLPAMKKNGGYIINTSSVAGFVGVFGYSDYSVTKFGLIGLSEVLKSELEQYNIKVAVLCPPDTDTPGYEEENKTKPLETLAISASAKLMKAEDVARISLKMLEKGKFLLLTNTESKLTFLLKSFFPKLLYSIIQSDVRKIQKTK
jgi:short-subunit dehydrogenase